MNYGIRPTFYESEYNMYYEDGMFSNPELEEFAPDLVFICTCIRNITNWPELVNDRKTVDEKLDVNANKFIGLWKHIRDTYHCPIIQNNFEYPFYRLLGNRDASDYRGHVNFVTRLNQRFYDYVDTHEGIYICDVNYISSSYGLDKWAAPYYWHMYKYAVAVPAIPYLSFNVANIVKSIYGKTRRPSTWIWTIPFGAELLAMMELTTLRLVRRLHWHRPIANFRSISKCISN